MERRASSGCTVLGEDLGKMACSMEEMFVPLVAAGRKGGRAGEQEGERESARGTDRERDRREKILFVYLADFHKQRCFNR